MTPKKKRRIIIWSIVAAVILAIVLFFVLHAPKHGGYTVETQPARIDSVATIITATGEIQPVTKVEVGELAHPSPTELRACESPV